jgi:hypothetical protein
MSWSTLQACLSLCHTVNWACSSVTQSACHSLSYCELSVQQCDTNCMSLPLSYCELSVQQCTQTACHSMSYCELSVQQCTQTACHSMSYCELSVQQCDAICCNVPKTMPPSCQALLQRMNHGFTATILRQNKCIHNGRWSNIKTMLIAFFDVEGLVLREFLPQSHNMNKTTYRTLLQWLWEAVCWKQPFKCFSRTWLVHHDSATCQATLSVREFFAQHSIHNLTQQIWSPVSSFSSPGRRAPWRGNDLKILLRYNWIWHSSWRSFRNRPSTHAMKSQSIIEIAACNL